MAWAKEPGPPTLPGKITYGRPGKSFSSGRIQTGTIAGGKSGPATSALRTSSPFVATSLDVIPPFATTKESGSARSTRRITSTRAPETVAPISKFESPTLSAVTSSQLVLPALGLQEPQYRHLDAAHPVERERRLELAGGRGHVGADQNEPVSLFGPLAVELLGSEDLRLGDAPARPQKGRPRAVEEASALLLRRQQPQHEDLEVRVGRRVEHHWPPAAHPLEELQDALGTALAEIGEADAQDLRGLTASPGLLLDPRLEIRGAVAEAVVGSKLSLSRREQLPVLAHPVDVVHRDPAGFEERRTDDKAVRPASTLLKRLRQHVGLRRVVASQGGVAAAHYVEVHTRITRGLREVPGDLPVQGHGLLLGEAAGVGEHEECRARLRKRQAQVIDRPGGEDRHAVHALDAGRVVVEDGHAPAALGYLTLDLLQGAFQFPCGRLGGQILPLVHGPFRNMASFPSHVNHLPRRSESYGRSATIAA